MTREERMTSMLETCIGDYSAALADTHLMKCLSDTDTPRRIELLIREDFLKRRIEQIRRAQSIS